MWNRQYEVTMQTPVGARYGTMRLTVDNRNVDGILDILKRANPFHGNISEDGNCQINGELTTLMHTISYEGRGKITRDALFLKLITARESFDISGLVSALSSEGEGDLKR